MMVLCTQVNKMYVIATLSVYPHRAKYMWYFETESSSFDINEILNVINNFYCVLVLRTTKVQFPPWSGIFSACPVSISTQSIAQ